MWRLQAGFAIPSQEARVPSAPDEGAAFNGWTRSDEGRRECRPDNVRGSPSGPIEEDTVAGPKIATVERRGCACRSHGAQHRKVQMKTIAPFRRSAPSRR